MNRANQVLFALIIDRSALSPDDSPAPSGGCAAPRPEKQQIGHSLQLRQRSQRCRDLPKTQESRCGSAIIASAYVRSSSSISGFKPRPLRFLIRLPAPPSARISRSLRTVNTNAALVRYRLISHPVFSYPFFTQLFLDFSRLRGAHVPFVPQVQSHLPAIPRLIV
jgi:hypothetical protein